MSPLDRETGLAQTVSVDPYETAPPWGKTLLSPPVPVIFVPLSQTFSAIDPAPRACGVADGFG
jgi:hypothetical protein